MENDRHVLKLITGKNIPRKFKKAFFRENLTQKNKKCKLPQISVR
jgi:hypothetical protein